MKIVNPSFGVSATGGEKMATAPVDWLRDPIALITNAKPNAHQLLDGIRTKLGAIRPIDNIAFFGKDSASQPAPAALYDEVVAKGYKAALLALAD
jgi:hypothetical protein